MKTFRPGVSLKSQGYALTFTCHAKAVLRVSHVAMEPNWPLDPFPQKTLCWAACE